MPSTLELPAAETQSVPLTYRTILVHAEPGRASSRRVEAAAWFARRLDARLIGLGAETLEPLQDIDPMMGAASAEWVVIVQEQVTKNLKAAETAFRSDAAGADVEWRAVQDYPTQALTRAADVADLVVVGPQAPGPGTRCVDSAAVVMGAGRPVLIVPEGRRALRAETVLVAWKSTRECRRAVADAMPLLREAKDVIVQAIVPKDDQRVAAELHDVVEHLRRHGVRARPLVSSAHDAGVAEELERSAAAHNVDLIVAGAYGHSRLREWAFGGVTRDLLCHPGRYVLMSH